ncbi:portal protein [Parvibaculaceae bacterium PLY_AMNH_Bact1]|nr:portal protein [Parvibaculaceae bacterium PLY_AMNH_Bact1]
MTKYGPVPPRGLPEQDYVKTQMLIERFHRAAEAHDNWATPAKQAVDFLEGRQWTAEEIAEMVRHKRPHLQFNIIYPLVRLVLGYQRNGKTDITFQPGDDARANEMVADILSKLEKNIAANTELDFIDTEVFMDGLVTGRGFFDDRLDFENNDLGEVRARARDPFATYLDPDADTYDLNESASYVIGTKYVSIDEIEQNYGKAAADLTRPFLKGETPIGPVSTAYLNDEITPIRGFGEREEASDYWDRFHSLIGNFVDTQRKTIRLMDIQHKVTENRNVVIDLETGDKKVLPENWGQERIQKVVAYAEHRGNPVMVQRRRVSRLQWTTLCGDLALYDSPSPYQSYTITPYFPYFRRGVARGMVTDLIDPQKEKNKRRSSEIDMVSKNANGGWIYHEKSLSDEQELNLQRFGSAPGVRVKWRGEKEPRKLEAGTSTQAHDRLESRADEDVHKISGLSESAMGTVETVQSGRALEAKQRQALVAIQMYFDNFSRSKRLQGKKHLELIQNHYTEARMARALGEDGKFAEILINQQQVDGVTGTTRILNDVTVGKYTVTVDEVPLAASFANAQFDEMMIIMEKIAPGIGQFIPMFADLIVDASSLPRKAEWIERLKQLNQAPLEQPPVDPGAPV